jgi:hypothetical protein
MAKFNEDNYDILNYFKNQLCYNAIDLPSNYFKTKIIIKDSDHFHLYNYHYFIRNYFSIQFDFNIQAYFYFKDVKFYYFMK